MPEPKPEPKRKPRPLRRVEVKQVMERMQTLFGRAQGIYNDDRSPNRADKILVVLDEGFKLAYESIDKWEL